MQQPRVREGKTPIQKPLCRLCECPTSDGHVLASQVDRLKLRKWAMEVMNLTEEDENLPDVVEEDALICYFCIWQAEFGDESGDEAVAWWPKNLDLDENARVLRENYSIGDVEQCWVQLEEIDLPEYEKEIPEERKCDSAVCLYCGNSYNRLMEHVKLMHKEAIKCGIRGCTTYFHTEEEKEQQMQHDFHANQCESRKIRCKYCETVLFLSSSSNLKKHMFRKHPEFPVLCTRPGCNEYFKTKSEMILHFNSHKRAINQDLYQCKHCEYFTTKMSTLSRHVEGRHMPKVFKCSSCNAKFGSKVLVNVHNQQYHTFDKCKSCGQDVAPGIIARHRRQRVCPKCKLRFKCLGLYQLHKKSCKQTPYSCKECGKSFNKSSKLYIHLKKVHTETAIVHCEHCDFSTYAKTRLSVHLQRKHLPKTIKCDECDKLFASESFLKDHKQRWHKYVRCAECAQEMCTQTMSKHRTVKICRCCKCKLKCSGLFQKHKKSCKSTGCKECGKTFNMSWKLNLHMHRVHNKGVIFRCDHCDFSTVHKGSMARHMQHKHLPHLP